MARNPLYPKALELDLAAIEVGPVLALIQTEIQHPDACQTWKAHNDRWAGSRTG